jgi:hypothetical protein
LLSINVYLLPEVMVGGALPLTGASMGGNGRSASLDE